LLAGKRVVYIRLTRVIGAGLREASVYFGPSGIRFRIFRAQGVTSVDSKKLLTITIRRRLAREAGFAFAQCAALFDK
jgi:hypothetical protein